MGNLKRYKKITSKNPEITQLQNSVDEALKPIVDSPIVDGVLVKDVCLKARIPNLVNHKLGRKALGWIIVRKRADSRIWDVDDYNNLNSTTIALTCSHDVTVDVWIF